MSLRSVGSGDDTEDDGTEDDGTEDDEAPVVRPAVVLRDAQAAPRADVSALPQRPPGQLPASFGQLFQQIGAELAIGLTLRHGGRPRGGRGGGEGGVGQGA
ncbi:hypothetical protein ACFC1T_20185 [Kitasatospora sp. NPDC056076]|uniref:hypothetical protein n=1 Tax=Kitasatospora sp. NPDC056076 TaxID=3345703 RepID=UPI0035DBD4EF